MMSITRQMRPLPLRSVKLTDSFWSKWQETLRDVTLEAIYQRMAESGRLENFRKTAEGQGRHVGRYYDDSDVYKWCEACAYALALGPHKLLKKRLDEVIELIDAAQEGSGYLNTYFQLEHPDLKWRNLGMMHELYCAGHLIEAGVAFFEEVDDRRLLDVAIKLADHIASIFGPGKRVGFCGHQEIELALIRLGRAAGDKSYVELARWMIEKRGKSPSIFEAELDDPEAMKLSPWARGHLLKDGVYTGEYLQDHAPIREHEAIVGHAVRGMYWYAAAMEVAEGDEPLAAAVDRVWRNLTEKRMYITGGCGPSARNEGFTADYDLPNLTAYAETCASVALIFWSQRLLHMTGNSDYADVVERALYNGAISGISESGDRFFYTNPLESRGEHQRLPWFDCACCPPNIARLIGSVAKQIVSVSDEAFWIHIPAGFEAETSISGVKTRLVCESNYPWSGEIKVRVEPAKPVRFALRVRIPDWADDVQTELPGLNSESEWDQGYAVFDKLWQSGDTLTMDFGMTPKWVEANPRVLDDLGRVALTRGPLVYCAEEHDLGYPPQLFSADLDAPVEQNSMRIKVQGFREKLDFIDDIYAAEGTTECEETEAIFAPYSAWCNRGANHMAVWTRRA